MYDANAFRFRHRSMKKWKVSCHIKSFRPLSFWVFPWFWFWFWKLCDVGPTFGILFPHPHPEFGLLRVVFPNCYQPVQVRDATGGVQIWLLVGEWFHPLSLLLLSTGCAQLVLFLGLSWFGDRFYTLPEDLELAW